MPKRKKNEEEKIMKYKYKIQKLMERQERYRRSRSRSPSRLPDSEENYHTDADAMEYEGLPSSQKKDSTPTSVLVDEEVAEMREMDKAQESPLEPEVPVEVDPADIALDSETLKALGKPVKEKQKYGPNINGDLAKMWTPLLKKGFEEAKDKNNLLEKYLIPNNCQLLQAPKLNPEILATVTDVIKNRDKKIEEDQQQLGHGITALNRALSLLATNTGDRSDIISMLSEASQILSDLHYGLTLGRKKLITPILDKKFLDLIKEVERNEFLYGGELSDKIKAMKNAQKSSQSIKKTETFKMPFKKTGNFSNPGNSKGPSRYQGLKPFNRSGPKRPTERNYKQPATYSQLKKSKPETKPPARK